MQTGKTTVSAKIFKVERHGGLYRGFTRKTLAGTVQKGVIIQVKGLFVNCKDTLPFITSFALLFRNCVLSFLRRTKITANSIKSAFSPTSFTAPSLFFLYSTKANVVSLLLSREFSLDQNFLPIPFRF